MAVAFLVLRGLDGAPVNTIFEWLLEPSGPVICGALPWRTDYESMRLSVSSVVMFVSIEGDCFFAAVDVLYR